MRFSCSSYRIVLAVPPALGLFAVLMAGCSLAYSPYVNPPARPLRMNQGEVVGAWSALAETRSQGAIGGGFGAYADGGGELGARYAFSDRLTLGMRLWARFKQPSEMNLDGYSFDALYMLNDSTASVQWGLASRAIFLMNGRRVDGRAVTLGGVAWLPKTWGLDPYVALAGGVGEYLGPDSTTADHWGNGVIGNLGASLSITDALRVGLEIASVVQYNRHDDEHSWYPVLGSLSLAWKF